jgi:O-antigen/teichoic acid export membrane protein
MVLSRVATLVISLAGTAVLARVLTPADFGLLAMVATFTVLLNQFSDLGLSMATIQRPDISDDQVSYLFWTNVGVGLVAALLTALFAPTLAWFYGEPKLTDVTLVLATAFVVSGAGVQHRALLRRQMRFATLAWIRVGVAVVVPVVGISAALAGWGYWSLVAMNLALAVFSTLAVWIWCGWRPGLPRSSPGMGSMLTFGWQITGSRLLGFLTRNLDNILIGKIWGDAALGFYGRAYQLLMLPVQQLINPLTSIVVPALSRLQNDEERYRNYYHRALLTLSAISMPAIVVAFVISEEIVRIILGPQWLPAVPIFRLLAPAAFIGTFNPMGWVWVSLNQTDRQLRWSAISTPFYVLAFAIGVQWGPEGVAACFSIAQIGLRYFGITYCYSATFLTIGGLGRAIWLPAVTSIASGGVVMVAFVSADPDLSSLASAVAKTVLYGFVYCGLWFLLPGGRRAGTDLIGLLRDMRG